MTGRIGFSAKETARIDQLIWDGYLAHVSPGVYSITEAGLSVLLAADRPIARPVTHTKVDLAGERTESAKIFLKILSLGRGKP